LTATLIIFTLPTFTSVGALKTVLIIDIIR
jgi:hypothetical protein